MEVFMDANANEGVLPLVTHLGVGMAERTVAAVTGLLEDAVNETRAAIGGTIDLGESVAKGALRLGRKLNDRVAELALEAIARGRSASLGVVSLAGDASSLLARANGAPPASRRAAQAAGTPS